MPTSLSTEQTQRIIQAAENLTQDAIMFLQGMICLPTINPPGRFYPECAHYIGNLLSSLGYHVQYQELTQDEVALSAPGRSASFAGRLKGVLGLFGRSAPA